MMVKDWKLFLYNQEQGMDDCFHPFYVLFNIVLEVLVWAIKQEKELKVSKLEQKK